MMEEEITKTVLDEQAKYFRRGALKADILKIGKETYIQQYLNDLFNKNEGNFSRRSHSKKDSTLFYCERHNKPTGKSSGKPETTRANSCPAYVSFKFVQYQKFLQYQSPQFKTYEVVVVNLNLVHENHDPSNPEEYKVARHADWVTDLVEDLLDFGLRPNQAVLRVGEHAECHGFFDTTDRRYYVTPKDVGYLSGRARRKGRGDGSPVYEPEALDTSNGKSKKKKRSVMSHTRPCRPPLDSLGLPITVVSPNHVRCFRMGKSDLVNVDFFCREKLKDIVLHYQPKIDDHQPLLIILQSQWQKDLMLRTGTSVLYLESTFSDMNVYHFSFYILLAKTDKNRTIPVAFIIGCDDSPDTLRKGFDVLKSKLSFSPKCVVIDNCRKEIAAIKTTWPKCEVIISWYHLLQGLHQWVSKPDSGIADSIETQREVINFIKQLKQCKPEAQFLAEAEEILKYCEGLSPNLAYYLKVDLFDYAAHWADFCRKGSALVPEPFPLGERFFKVFRYRLLHGYACRRLDDLLIHLTDPVVGFYGIMTKWIDDRGRGRNKTFDNVVQQSASELFIKYECKFSYDTEAVTFDVPTSSDTVFPVSLVDLACTCLYSAQGRLCKHIFAARMFAEKYAELIPKEEVQRQILSQRIVGCEAYAIEGDVVVLFCEDGIRCTPVRGSCTCMAATLGASCLCKTVVQQLLSCCSGDEQQPVGETILLAADSSDQGSAVSTAQSVATNDKTDRSTMPRLEEFRQMLHAMAEAALVGSEVEVAACSQIEQESENIPPVSVSRREEFCSMLVALSDMAREPDFRLDDDDYDSVRRLYTKHGGRIVVRSRSKRIRSQQNDIHEHNYISKKKK